MVSVAHVATIFLPLIEIAWRYPSAAITGNTASALSASVVAPVIPRRPGAAQPPTNAFHTTFSRGNSEKVSFIRNAKHAKGT